MVVAVIPARSGSKRVKDKNIRNFCGKPLMAWAIEKAFESGVFNRVVVSSDSEEYLDIAGRYGPIMCLKRPAEAAEDDSADQQWIDHMIESLGPIDFAILRPTNPFRSVSFIQTAVKRFHDHPEVREVRAIRPTIDHPYKMWVSVGSIIEPLFPTPAYLSPTSSLYPVFVQGAGIEIRRYGSTGPVLPIYTTTVEGMDIDTEEQFAFCEMLAKHRPEVEIAQ